MTLRRLLELPLADIAFADIEALIADEAEEDVRLELKRELPSNDRQGDPWMQGSRKIADRARDGLAKEVVALANGYGGVIVVGVDESEDQPKRARGPDPILIPRVVECADRLLQSLDSLIDPPLPVLEIRGILKPDSEGDGVLVIRTGPSTRGPHGYGRPPLAYMRRGSRSEPMTMRDLQGALFETRTRGERVTAIFEERRNVLVSLIQKGPQGAVIETGEAPFTGRKVIYFRCTIVSTSHLGLRADELTRASRIIRPDLSSPAFGGGNFNYQWMLRLNGVENIDRSTRHLSKWFIGDYGIVDVNGFFALDKYRGVDNLFPPAVFPAVSMQVLAMGELLRRNAKSPGIELAIECEFFNGDQAKAVHGDGRAFDHPTPVPEGSIRIGPFLLGNIEDYQAVYSELERGIWHGLGQPVGSHIKFDMPRWLATMAGN